MSSTLLARPAATSNNTSPPSMVGERPRTVVTPRNASCTVFAAALMTIVAYGEGSAMGWAAGKAKFSKGPIEANDRKGMELLAAAKTADANGSGSLNSVELGAALAGLGLPDGIEHRKELMATMDQDKDGVASYSEFVSAIERAAVQQTAQGTNDLPRIRASQETALNKEMAAEAETGGKAGPVQPAEPVHPALPTDLVPPVDVVIPWSGDKAGDMSGVNRDDGIVRYTIRSIRKHMSWVRTIYLFADPIPNPPKWMSTEFGDQVQLVDRCAHFIGGSTNCPTQNTFAVYANFHTIPGLAEHFIACDDDVLITSPLTRENFFIDGKAVASVSGVTDIYYGITIKDGVSYVTELATPYNDGGKRALPTKLPKQIHGVMHTAYPLLRSAIEEMQTEFADWFGFVSSHRVRFCFHQNDKHQPNNVNGACFHENTKYAFVWYMHSRGLVTPPKRKITEFSATYADVTEHRLGKLFEPGKHTTVNINDSTMWLSKDLVALSKEPTAQAEYGARRKYLQSALNVAFPLAKCLWSNLSASRVPSTARNRANYDAMAKLYTDATEMGVYLGPLVGGALRCLYMYGGFCEDKTDTDIDLMGGDKGHKTPATLKGVLPHTTPHLSFSSSDFSQFGSCECTLPNGRSFVCIRHVRQFMAWHWGASWWVPIAGMKPSVLTGSDKRPGLVDTVVKSLRKYQNQDGVIDDLSSVRLASTTDAEMKTTVAELNMFLSRTAV